MDFNPLYCVYFLSRHGAQRTHLFLGEEVSLGDTCTHGECSTKPYFVIH